MIDEARASELRQILETLELDEPTDGSMPMVVTGKSPIPELPGDPLHHVPHLPTLPINPPPVDGCGGSGGSSCSSGCSCSAYGDPCCSSCKK